MAHGVGTIPGLEVLTIQTLFVYLTLHTVALKVSMCKFMSVKSALNTRDLYRAVFQLLHVSRNKGGGVLNEF